MRHCQDKLKRPQLDQDNKTTARRRKQSPLLFNISSFVLYSFVLNHLLIFFSGGEENQVSTIFIACVQGVCNLYMYKIYWQYLVLLECIMWNFSRRVDYNFLKTVFSGLFIE